MASKKVEQVQDRVTRLKATRGSVTAFAGYEDCNYEHDGSYYIAYHNGAMPSHAADGFDTLEEFEDGMRGFVKDLRSWSVVA